MSAMQRRIQAKRPLPAADVADRLLLRIESAVFESSYRAQLEAGMKRHALGVVRAHESRCDRCGEVVVFNGTDAEWDARRITWADVHVCGDVA